MLKQGVLTVISGFAGAGKGTIVKALLEKYPEDYQLSISVTTRQPRLGEQDGRDYFFRTRKEFEELIKKDGFIEWAEYVGNYYGTPRTYVEEQLAMGNNIILEIERQGAFHVKELYPSAVLMFVTPPSVEVLEKRLTGRGTETMEVVKKRMHKAAEESTFMKYYHHVIINDDVASAVQQIHTLIQEHKNGSIPADAEMEEISRKDFIEKIQKEFEDYR